MRVIVAKKEEEKRLSYRLRFDTMCQDLGWLPVENYGTPEERDEYDINQSMSFLALDTSGNAIGTARLILPGIMPLPIEKHFELYPRELIEAIYGKMEYTVEASRFIVPENHIFKNHEITIMLYKELIKMCMTMSVTHILASVDYRFFRLQKILGFQFTDVGKPQLYMGSKTIPCILSVKKLPEILLEKNPRLYDYIMSRDGQVEDAVLV